MTMIFLFFISFSLPSTLTASFYSFSGVPAPLICTAGYLQVFKAG